MTMLHLHLLIMPQAMVVPKFVNSINNQTKQKNKQTNKCKKEKRRKKYFSIYKICTI